MNRISSTIAMMAALTVLAASCQREDPLGVAKDSNAVCISPAVDGTFELKTKASSGRSVSLTSEDLSLEVESIPCSQECPDTKGTLVNRDGSGTIPFSTSDIFYMSAWDSDGTSAFIDWTTVKYFTTEIGTTGIPRNTWNTTDDGSTITDYSWFPEETKHFYAYAYHPDGAGKATVSKDASTGKATGMSLVYEVPESASSQKDLLMGYYGGTGIIEGKLHGTAPIVFHHALTAMVLKLGTVKGASSFEITGIAVEGVYKSGTAVMTNVSAVKTDPADIVTWTPDVDGEGKPETITVSQTVTMPVPTDEDPNPEIGEPFIIIPQTFTDGGSARIRISISIDGREVDIYSPLTSADTWKAGYVNVYTINYNGHEGVQLWANGPYWATANVGAQKPEEYGMYYTWGSVTGYTCTNFPSSPSNSIVYMFVDKNGEPEGGYSFDFDTYVEEIKGWKYTDEKNKLQKFDLYKNLNNHFDAAYAEMGAKWRMPTMTECQLLITNTVMTYEKRNGVDGFKFTGKDSYANRSIFIPASGLAEDKKVKNWTECAGLWTRTHVTGDDAESYTMLLGYNPGAGSGHYVDDHEFSTVARDQVYKGRVIRAVENTDEYEDKTDDYQEK